MRPDEWSACVAVSAFTTGACWRIDEVPLAEIEALKERLREGGKQKQEALYVIEWLQCELRRAQRTDEEDDDY